MACHACFIRIHEVREHLLLLLNYNLQTARKTNAFLILTYFVLKSLLGGTIQLRCNIFAVKTKPNPTAAVGKLSTNCFGNQKVLTVKHDVKERRNTLAFLRQKKKKRLPATK